MAILIAANVFVLTAHASTKSELNTQRSMVVKEKSARESVSKRLTELSDKKVEIDSSLREERLKTEKLEEENQSLKVNLQAKKEREAEEARLAAAQPAVKQVQTQAKQPAPTVQVSGDKHTWLAASGIPESEWHYVDFIVGRESGWDPCAYNPGLSDCGANPTSACGLAQSLPCGKQSGYGHWTDPVANLKWQHEYVKGRYGGYAQAYNFWLANHWY